MIVVIDNYDSFVFNLARYFQRLNEHVCVFRNDSLTIPQLAEMKPTALVVSPGPCTPSDSGISIDAIRYFSGKIPVLGICLGHQAIAQAFGGSVRRATVPIHGKKSSIHHSQTGIFQQVPNPFDAGRYHSLVVDEPSLSNEFNVTARSEDDSVMAIEHREHPTVGLQFHPESILTEHGFRLIANFVGHWRSIHDELPANELAELKNPNTSTSSHASRITNAIYR